jgi:hypothetical protein
MASMNQNPVIRLLDFIPSGEAWGNDEGRKVFGALLQSVEEHPGVQVFQISLAGVRRTDASFPRESVVELAKRFRKQVAFFLTDMTNEDLVDNWDLAAQKKEQPLFLKLDGGGFRILGPQLSAAKQKLLDYVLKNKRVRTNRVATDLCLKVSNASTQLKELWEMGYLLRTEEVADSGGVEFVYCATI